MKFLFRWTKIPYDLKIKRLALEKQDNVLKVFNNYSVVDRDKFLTHPVFSKLFSLLFYTFLPVYRYTTKEEFKEVVLIELLNVLDLMLNTSVGGGPVGAEISKKETFPFFEISQKIEH